MKHLRIAVFVTLVVTALLVLQGTTIAPALFSTTQQQRAVEVDLRRQLQAANRELASVQERLELASAQGQRLQERQYLYQEFSLQMHGKNRKMLKGYRH